MLPVRPKSLRAVETALGVTKKSAMLLRDLMTPAMITEALSITKRYAMPLRKTNTLAMIAKALRVMNKSVMPLKKVKTLAMMAKPLKKSPMSLSKLKAPSGDADALWENGGDLGDDLADIVGGSNEDRKVTSDTDELLLLLSQPR